jgi:hypothetical protein
VSVIHVQPTPRGAGHLLRAVAAASLLVLAMSAPAGAVEGPTRLFDPVVSPTNATPTTTVTLSVEYRNREGSAPAYVRVVIDGRAHDMTGDGGDDWKQGVGHRYSTKLAAGTHEVSFVAADTRKFTDEVDGGTITIAIPPPPPPPPTPTPPPPNPKPDPTPGPTPGSEPNSGPAPTPSPVPVPGGTSTDPGGPGSDTGTGTDGGGAPGGTGMIGDREPAAEATADGSDVQTDPGAGADRNAQGGSVLPGPFGSGGSGGATGPGAGPDAPAGPGATGGSGGTGGAGGSGGSGVGTAGGVSWGALAAALDTLRLDAGGSTLSAMSTLVGTSGAVAMTMAFAIFGKKRRDEEQPAPDEVLEANAARGDTGAASADLVGLAAAAVLAAPPDLEASMPRWRRPSLQAARKADPTRYVSTSPSLRFDVADASAIGYERRLIRYRVVRLLDAPDELRAVEIGQLDLDDEVQLLEKSGAYWLVRTPDGRQGWLHKMTLGEVVSESATSTADAWNVGDIDGDVLSAYLAARARA